MEKYNTSEAFILYWTTICFAKHSAEVETQKLKKTSSRHMPPSKSFKDFMINLMWKCRSQYFLSRKIPRGEKMYIVRLKLEILLSEGRTEISNWSTEV